MKNAQSISTKSISTLKSLKKISTTWAIIIKRSVSHISEARYFLKFILLRKLFWRMLNNFWTQFYLEIIFV